MWSGVAGTFSDAVEIDSNEKYSGAIGVPEKNNPEESEQCACVQRNELPISWRKDNP